MSVMKNKIFHVELEHNYYSLFTNIPKRFHNNPTLGTSHQRGYYIFKEMYTCI